MGEPATSCTTLPPTRNPTSIGLSMLADTIVRDDRGNRRGLSFGLRDVPLAACDSGRGQRSTADAFTYTKNDVPVGTPVSRWRDRRLRGHLLEFGRAGTAPLRQQRRRGGCGQGSYDDREQRPGRERSSPSLRLSSRSRSFDDGRVLCWRRDRRGLRGTNVSRRLQRQSGLGMRRARALPQRSRSADRSTRRSPPRVPLPRAHDHLGMHL
jgi:hypothetical protein